MSRDLKLLERHFRQWRQDGLVTAELESALRKSSGELQQRSTSSVVRTALAGLGGGLLLAGLILIVAENWEALHRGVKLGAWAALQVAFLLVAYHLGRVPPNEIGGVDGTRTPSVSEVKRERFTPSSEAPLVTRDLRRDRQKR